MKNKVTEYEVRENEASGKRNRSHILVVEDNELNQELIKSILDSLGFDVLCTENGEDAVTVSRGKEFDMIHMDIDLPGIDGLEAMKQIRKGGTNQCPIVALTAHAMKGDRERFIRAGMNDFLSKPIDIHKLQELLKNLIGTEAKADRNKDCTAVSILTQYDIESVAKDTGIAVDRLKAIIEKFFSTKLDGYLESLEEAINSNDFSRIRKESHKLRGASTNLRLEDMVSYLKEMENNAENNVETDYSGLLAGLKDNVETLRKSILGG